MKKTIDHNIDLNNYPNIQRELMNLNAHVRMLEMMCYRLFTGEELSTGMLAELVRIINKENPNYFKDKGS